jgi:hypothetical protein
MNEDDVPGWEGNRRDAAMTVAKTLSAVWIVRPGDGRPVIAYCPCCGADFKTARAAKLVADAVYPAL